MSEANENGSGGSVSVRSLLNVSLGLLQLLVVGACYLLYDYVRDTNDTIDTIQKQIQVQQIKYTEDLGELKTQVGIINSRLDIKTK